jgi:hypothetical protein
VVLTLAPEYSLPLYKLDDHEIRWLFAGIPPPHFKAAPLGSTRRRVNFWVRWAVRSAAHARIPCRAAGRAAALERSVRCHCGPAIPGPAATLKLLADFFQDTADGVFPAGSDASRKETAFALRYAAKEIDIIPDFVPEIGYADDSLIVRTVLSRHQDVFRDYCRFRKIRCSKISLAP